MSQTQEVFPLGLHEKQEGITTKILQSKTILEKSQNEYVEKLKLEEKKTRFAELSNVKKDRIPIEERISKAEEQYEPTETEHSLIIEQTRELAIDFNSLLKKFLFPDFPPTRFAKKKYIEEVNRFRKSSFKEIVRAINVKVSALCSFEGLYDKEMFDLDHNKGWFDNKVKEVLEHSNFESAQFVVSSVMQIVMQDEVVLHKRKFLTKMR